MKPQLNGVRVVNDGSDLAGEDAGARERDYHSRHRLRGYSSVGSSPRLYFSHLTRLCLPTSPTNHPRKFVQRNHFSTQPRLFSRKCHQVALHRNRRRRTPLLLAILLE